MCLAPCLVLSVTASLTTQVGGAVHSADHICVGCGHISNHIMFVCGHTCLGCCRNSPRGGGFVTASRLGAYTSFALPALGGSHILLSPIQRCVGERMCALIQTNVEFRICDGPIFWWCGRNCDHTSKGVWPHHWRSQFREVGQHLWSHPQMCGQRCGRKPKIYGQRSGRARKSCGQRCGHRPNRYGQRCGHTPQRCGQ